MDDAQAILSLIANLYTTVREQAEQLDRAQAANAQLTAQLAATQTAREPDPG